MEAQVDRMGAVQPDKAPHEVTVERRTGSNNRLIGWRGVCTCGWRSRRYGLGNEALVARDLKRHLSARKGR